MSTHKLFAVFLLLFSGVDPLVSGLLYFISIPLFIASLAIFLRNIHIGKPILVPGLLSLLFLAGSYLYLASAGTMFPAWAYLAATMVIAIPIAFTMIYRNQGKSQRRKLTRRRART
jgi:uncharacterized membrane protein YhhN